MLIINWLKYVAHSWSEPDLPCLSQLLSQKIYKLCKKARQRDNLNCKKETNVINKSQNRYSRYNKGPPTVKATSDNYGEMNRNHHNLSSFKCNVGEAVIVSGELVVDVNVAFLYKFGYIGETIQKILLSTLSDLYLLSARLKPKTW